MSKDRNENFTENPSGNLTDNPSADRNEYLTEDPGRDLPEIAIESMSESSSESRAENLVESAINSGSGNTIENATEETAENTAEKRAENTVENGVENTGGSIPGETTASYQTGLSTEKPKGRPNIFMSKRVSKSMSKEEIMAAMVECSAKLGHVPSYVEMIRTGEVSGRQIMKHFGSYTRALRACNLERSSGGQRVPLEKLFHDWTRVVREIKKIPSKSEYENLGKHSITPLKSRFGSWGQVPRYLRRHIEEQGRTEEWKDVLELIREYEQGQDGLEKVAAPEWEQKKPRVMTDRPVYGPLIRPYPMIHGPINENGVLYLFGTVSERLGFVVTLIQTGFPDCLALRLVDVDRWQPVKIEFEYESRNFLKHMHDPSGCDIIVCWKHNWPECPLEVIELSKIVGQI
jgi:hypothetical protein